MLIKVNFLFKLVINNWFMLWCALSSYGARGKFGEHEHSAILDYQPREHDSEAGGDPAKASNRQFSEISRVSRLSLVFSYYRMVLKYRDKKISSLDDLQKLTAKDLREIFNSHGESTGGTKANLV